MYKKEEGTGRVRLTMSKDSTCHLLAKNRLAGTFFIEMLINVLLYTI